MLVSNFTGDWKNLVVLFRNAEKTLAEKLLSKNKNFKESDVESLNVTYSQTKLMHRWEICLDNLSETVYTPLSEQYLTNGEDEKGEDIAKAMEFILKSSLKKRLNNK